MVCGEASRFTMKSHTFERILEFERVNGQKVGSQTRPSSKGVVAPYLALLRPYVCKSPWTQTLTVTLADDNATVLKGIVSANAAVRRVKTRGATKSSSSRRR